MSRILDLLASEDPVPTQSDPEFDNYNTVEQRLIVKCEGDKEKLLYLYRRVKGRGIVFSGARHGITVVPGVTCVANVEGQTIEGQTAGDFFGSGAKLLGNELFIGERLTPNPDLFNFPTGSVHYYSRPNADSDFVFQEEFFADDGGTSNGMFGTGIAYDGDRLAVGTPNVSRTVDIFTVSGGTITFEQEITQNTASGASNFGQSLDIDGDHMLVGAPLDASGVGRVEYWERVATVWTFRSSFVTAEAGSLSFGIGVAMTNNTTAYILREDEADSISIEKWTRSGTTWTLDSTPVNDYSTHGTAVSVAPLDTDGTNLIVGFPQFDNGGAVGDDYGAITVFDQDGNVLAEEVGDTLDYEFGYSATIDGTESVIGDHRADPAAGADAGSASVWELCF